MSIAEKKATSPARTDAIVTARVPIAVKERGNAVLKKIGATPTELVNAAYEYVLQNKTIPPVSSPLVTLAGVKRELTVEQKEKLRDRMQRTTFDIPASYWSGRSDAELLEEAVREKYEALA